MSDAQKSFRIVENPAESRIFYVQTNSSHFYIPENNV